ncbi:MAG: hypothetical protein U5Q44_11690 [Dehalococcoidia bacterium]|nr:hypothetical protein [Dehalococcoidia bacterium]
MTCTFTNVYSVPALTLVKELDTTGDPDPPDADQWTLTAVPGPSGASGISSDVSQATPATSSESWRPRRIPP